MDTENSSLNKNNNPEGDPTGGQNQDNRAGMMSSSTGTDNTAQEGGGGDPLDKGVDFVEKKAGHEQSHSTTEKISDGVRKGFQKMTGKDVPVKDQQYS
ncbi:hypothetical protein BU17DRAFT_89592 [Hysterangium stoloniferum]|nr:hypothetical protein BU17DRAFT_89592 [Hysterangium stoloniferum]